MVLPRLDKAYATTVQSGTSNANTISTAAALRSSRRGLATEFVRLVEQDPRGLLEKATQEELRWALHKLLLAYDTWFVKPRREDANADAAVPGKDGKTWHEAVSQANTSMGDLTQATMWLWIKTVSSHTFFWEVWLTCSGSSAPELCA